MNGQEPDKIAQFQEIVALLPPGLQQLVLEVYGPQFGITPPPAPPETLGGAPPAPPQEQGVPPTSPAPAGTGAPEAALLSAIRR